MSISSFLVVTNALRLNLLSIRETGKEKNKVTKREESIEKEEKMEKILKIEGMMCGHCEAAVKKALEALPQVSEARVSHEEGTAVVTLQEEVSDTILKETVEARDYQVVSIA